MMHMLPVDYGKYMNHGQTSKLWAKLIPLGQPQTKPLRDGCTTPSFLRSLFEIKFFFSRHIWKLFIRKSYELFYAVVICRISHNHADKNGLD